MTDNIRPTASADAHAQSMADQTPLIEQSLDRENPITNNTDINGYQSGSTTLNLSGNPNQSIKPSSSNKPKIIKVSSKLFQVSQLKTWEFYQSLISEFIGTMLLVIVCTSTGLPVASKAVPNIDGSLAAGLIVATIVVGFGHISGAHINPAVTITFLTTMEIDFLRGFFYIVTQLLGATSASFLVRAITPLEARNNLGMTMITNGVSLTQAFMVEFLITFILCYTVHSICDKNRSDVGGSKALAVGFAVTIGCLFGGPYTGASMNPSRSFGPALVMNLWKDHWIYWIGPLTGSIAAALIYKYILKKSPPIVVHS